MTGAGFEAADKHLRILLQGHKSLAAADIVFIDHPQTAKTHVRGILVIGEGKSKSAFKPAVVSLPPFMGAAQFYGHTLLLSVSGIRFVFFAAFDVINHILNNHD